MHFWLVSVRLYVCVSALEVSDDNSLYKFTCDIDVDMYFITVLYFRFCVGLIDCCCYFLLSVSVQVIACKQSPK